MRQEKQEPKVTNFGIIYPAQRMDWKTGKMVDIKRTILDVGQKVLYSGAYNVESWFVVIGEPNGNKNQPLVEIGGSHRKMSYSCEDHDRSIDERFGIGLYYDNSGERLDAETIAKLVHDADVQERWEERRRIRKEEADAKEKAELLTKWQGILTPLSNGWDGKILKGNIVAYIKHHFPGLKFSASKDYTSYRIKWKDGPTEEELETLLAIWRDHTFDCYTDYNDYTPSNFNRLFGGVEYSIDLRRELSEGNDENKSYYVRPTEKPIKKVTKSDAGYDLQYVDYTERAFAIIGDIKTHYKLLESLGGSYNSRLRCGKGFIFSKRREEKVRQELGI